MNYKRPVLALRIDDSAPSASIEYYVNLWQKLDATDGIEQTTRSSLLCGVPLPLQEVPEGHGRAALGGLGYCGGGAVESGESPSPHYSWSRLSASDSVSV